MSQKGKILFIPMSSHSHINYCVPICNRFLELYGEENYEIYFALNDEMTKKVQKLCPKAKFEVYENEETAKFKGNEFVQMIQNFGDTWCDDSIEYIKKSVPVFQKTLAITDTMYQSMTEIIDKIKPDLIIFDQIIASPVGIDHGYKYAHMVSCALSFIGYEKFPPPQSGLPTDYKPENVKIWEDFIDKAYKSEPFLSFKNMISNAMKEKGVEGLDDTYFFFKPSPYLNIYGYPKELDYQEEENRKLPGNWLRMETPVRKPYPEPFEIPEKLRNKTGKLIYFSLGSMSSAYRPLMQKMLDILEQLPHRFIVSTGPIGDEYEMKDNMYGEKFLPQFSVLQTVDMVISHGGNNTLTETFCFGKPLIVLPLFGDQKDNAQRIHDKGLGRRCCIFDPVDKLKQDLIEAIEYCSREDVVNKMKQASERIQKDSGLDRACEEILKFVKK